MTLSARDEILARIRERQPPLLPIPDLQGEWIAYADPLAQFVESVRSVGGNGILLKDGETVPQVVKELPHYTSARRICSLIPEIDRANVILESIDDPHQLEDVDLAIVPAEFGVAENGAVWIDTSGLRHRSFYFLAQHLIIVVPVSEIVQTMHAAYERLMRREEHPFRGAGFGMFVSGPSKTADIEQSLVIGAHGARSLTVLLTQ